MWNPKLFIKLWIKAYFKIENVNDLPITGLDRARRRESYKTIWMQRQKNVNHLQNHFLKYHLVATEHIGCCRKTIMLNITVNCVVLGNEKITSLRWNTDNVPWWNSDLNISGHASKWNLKESQCTRCSSWYFK